MWAKLATYSPAHTCCTAALQHDTLASRGVPYAHLHIYVVMHACWQLRMHAVHGTLMSLFTTCSHVTAAVSVARCCTIVTPAKASLKSHQQSKGMVDPSLQRLRTTYLLAGCSGCSAILTVGPATAAATPAGVARALTLGLVAGLLGAFVVAAAAAAGAARASASLAACFSAASLCSSGSAVPKLCCCLLLARAAARSALEMVAFTGCCCSSAGAVGASAAAAGRPEGAGA